MSLEGSSQSVLLFIYCYVYCLRIYKPIDLDNERIKIFRFKYRNLVELEHCSLIAAVMIFQTTTTDGKSIQSQLKQTLTFLQEKNSLPNTIEIDGKHLTLAMLKRISTDSKIHIKLTDNTIKLMDENSLYLDEMASKSDDTFIYGMNTGFGGSADVRAKNTKAVQDALLRLLNVGFGKTFLPNLVKCAMVVRVNSLGMAYSGVSSNFVQLLVNVLNNNILPAIPLRGSISASGDLIPLSYVAATLIGREDLNVFHDGEATTCGIALRKANIQPAKVFRRDVLAVVNGTSFTVGVAAPMLYDVNIACLLTQVCTGLAVEGLHGTTESFHSIIHDLLPHCGQREVAKNIRRILHDSKLANHKLDIHVKDQESVTTQRLKQDRYCLRSAPQWLGPVVETLRDANRKFAIELQGVSDNPIIDHRTKTVLNGANFQGETLSITLDHIRQSIGVCGKILFAQFSELVNVNLNFGLPPNLSGSDFHTDFGYKGADIAMAAYMSELDHVVNPMSNHVLSAELHNQSVNSLALISYRLTAEALEIFQMMLANHIHMVVQAIDLRHLQTMVTEKLVEYAATCGKNSIFDENREWFEFIFCREEVLASVGSVNCNKITPYEQNAMDELYSIYADIQSGHCYTSKHLGQGKYTKFKLLKFLSG